MPLSRRELIQSGLLVPALGNLAAQTAIADSAASAIWLIDNQLPDAMAIAAQARTSAAAVHSFTSEPGTVWMRELAPRLRTAPVALGGYTSAATLFCLHYLARDHGLTLVALGRGAAAPEPMAVAADSPIDLRDPGFAESRHACTWLMLPRRA